MQTSIRGLKFIEAQEGTRLTVYDDGYGYPTAGVGHRVLPSDGYHLGDHISPQQAEIWLAEDVQIAEAAVNAAGVELAQHEFDALVSFAFNVGTHAFEDSSLRNKLRAGDKAGAAEELLRWNHVRQQVSAGLTKRRERERQLFLTGDYGDGEQAPAPVEDRSTQASPENIERIEGEPVADSGFDWGAIGRGIGAVATAINPLAGAIISAFAPLAQEKLTSILAKHTDRPEVAQKVSDAVISAVIQATGKTDPIDAVAEARKNPEILQQVERDTMAELDRMAPLFDRLAQYDQQEFDRAEAARNSAALREGAPTLRPMMTRHVYYLMVGLLIFLGALIGVQTWLLEDHKPSGELVVLFVSLATIVAQEFRSQNQYSFGSSGGSSAKDAVIAELAKRK